MNIVIVDTSPSSFWRFPQKLLIKLESLSSDITYTIVKDVKDLKKSLSQCDYIIAFSFPKIFIKKNTNLKEIIFLSSGIPSSFTKSTDYKVSTLTGINSKSVAGHALHLMMKHLRADIIKAELRPQVLEKKNIGILGHGAIGTDLYKMLSLLTNTKVMTRKKNSSDNFYNYDKKEKFYNDLDYIFITTALNEETIKLFTQENFFSMLNPSCVIINIARGELIDENLLIDHLDKNPKSFYLTDVTHPEPYPQDGALCNHHQVFITKHIAGTYEGIWEDIELYITKKVNSWKM